MLDDLGSFISSLKEKAAAWVELEKKSKKSRRKKHDGKNSLYMDGTYYAKPDENFKVS